MGFIPAGNQNVDIEGKGAGAGGAGIKKAEKLQML